MLECNWIIERTRERNEEREPEWCNQEMANNLNNGETSHLYYIENLQIYQQNLIVANWIRSIFYYTRIYRTRHHHHITYTRTLIDVHHSCDGMRWRTLDIIAPNFQYIVHTYHSVPFTTTSRLTDRDVMAHWLRCDGGGGAKNLIAA